MTDVPAAADQTPSSAPQSAPPASAPAPAPAPASNPEPAPAPAPSPASTSKYEGWRDDFVKVNPALEKYTNKYTSPIAIAEALAAQEKEFNSGKYKLALPENPTPEELGAWRKSNGIPETVDGYEFKLGEGRNLSEADKEIAKSFASRMHELNAPQSIVNTAMEWWYDAQEVANAERSQMDSQQKAATEEALRAEWGTDYLSNVNAVENYLTGKNPDAVEALKSARAADGTLLMNNPAVRRMLLEQAIEVNPIAPLLPRGMGSDDASIEARIAEIREISIKNRPAYDKDTKMQEEYARLLQVQKHRKQQNRAA